MCQVSKGLDTPNKRRVFCTLFFEVLPFTDDASVVYGKTSKKSMQKKTLQVHDETATRLRRESGTVQDGYHCTSPIGYLHLSVSNGSSSSRYANFGFEGRIFVLVVPVPSHCLSYTFHVFSKSCLLACRIVM